MATQERWVRLDEVLALLPEEQRRMVMATLEPEPITLHEAARRFGISLERLYKWVQRGHLPVLGHRTHPRGRPYLLVDAREVSRLAENPPKPGRPSPNGELPSRGS